MISNILSKAKQIDIYDSVYSDIEENTEALVSGMFNQPVELKVFPNWKSKREVWIVGFIVLLYVHLFYTEHPRIFLSHFYTQNSVIFMF